MNMTIVCYAEYKNIDTIVIGHDSGWKPEVNMGKRNNQNFVRIHFNSLMHTQGGEQGEECSDLPAEP